MAKQKVLRDFSELRPIEQRIELVAAGISQIVFKGKTNEDFRPKEGTQVHRVWKMTKLDERQQIAWQAFMDDVALSHGKSGSVCSAYGEQVSHGDGSDFRVPKAYANAYLRRIECLFTQFLSRKERTLLYELLQDTLRGQSSLQLETIGIIRSGYTDKVSARAAGVVHTQILLDRVADFYGV